MQAVLSLRRRRVARWRPGLHRRPRTSRRVGRNADWRELNTARHHLDARQLGVPVVRGLGPGLPRRRPWRVIDPTFAKSQLLLLTREWYMHANGQLPAYEWRFGDVNPPVHAWAAWRVYQIERRHDRAGRPAASSSGSSTSSCSTSPGGSTARTSTAPMSSRAASSAWTTSACSTATRRCPAGPTSARPTARPGWACSA